MPIASDLHDALWATFVVQALLAGTVKGRMRLGLKKIREYFDSRGMAVPG